MMCVGTYAHWNALPSNLVPGRACMWFNRYCIDGGHGHGDSYDEHHGIQQHFGRHRHPGQKLGKRGPKLKSSRPIHFNVRALDWRDSVGHDFGLVGAWTCLRVGECQGERPGYCRIHLLVGKCESTADGVDGRAGWGVSVSGRLAWACCH
jgi:hypothetical protein